MCHRVFLGGWGGGACAVRLMGVFAACTALAVDVAPAQEAADPRGTNCCSTGHGPGCDDPFIQNCVCAQDPFCCDNDWDSICVGEVDGFGCGTCSGGGVGACCLLDGSCLDFVDSGTCAANNGTYQGDGTDCGMVFCPGSETEACCFTNGSCSDDFPDDCLSFGGTPQGFGTSCFSTVCPSALEACCFTDGSCVDDDPANCTSNGGVPQGPGSDCVSVSCPSTEACCFDGGGCIDDDPGNCFASGGSPQGPGTDCGTTICPQPFEACCFSDGSCTDENPSDCSTNGGTPQGPGTDCGTTFCPQPFEACCFSDGSCSDEEPATCFSGGGTPQGPGTDCGATICVQPFEACCYDDGTCTDQDPNDCSTNGGSSQGFGTDCGTVVCPQPLEACCFSDGSCSDEEPATCFSGGGTPQGPGTDCGATICVQPFEACCYDDGTCTDQDPNDCSTNGGTPQGLGTDCGTTICPQPFEACCFSDGSCTDDEPGNCFAGGGTPQGPGTNCGTIICPQPFEACCYGDGTCTDEEPSDCSTNGGSPQGFGTDCGTVVCPQPLEACCFSDGSCSDEEPATCFSGGGTPQGPGTDCGATICVQPFEACCYDDGTCTDQDPNDCSTNGGSPQGFGTDCGTTICPQPLEACCFSDGSCSDEEPATCFSGGGTPQGPGTDCGATICVQPFEACCYDDGTCTDQDPNDCSTNGGTPQGLGTDCGTTMCAQPLEACCYGDGTCTDEDPGDCSTNGGSPQGPGSDCGMVKCVQITEACCLPDGTCEDIDPNICFAVKGAPQGPDTDCASGICEQPLEACCYEDGSCADLPPADCSASGGVSQGPGTDCSTAFCPQPLEACCFPDGSCSDIDSASCFDGGGVTQGPGTECLTICCPQPIEACCFSDGSCTDLEPSDCAANGGTPQGPATDCGTVFCEEPVGACCFSDGSCAELTPSSCQSGGGIYQGDDTNCATTFCEGQEPCSECGPGPHWVDSCTGGTDSMPSGAIIGVDLDFDCVPDTTIVLSGPVIVSRTGSMDDSANFPGLRPIDGHSDVIDTEIVFMVANGGGVTLTIGAGQGNMPLAPSFGAIAEQFTDPLLADSFFNVFFEVHMGGGNYVYNQEPLQVTEVIDCLPPLGNYVHPSGCLPLYTSPAPGGGVHVANFVTGNHNTFPPPPTYWTTWREEGEPEQTYQDVSLPMDFFGPGCEPFEGRIEFRGDPLGGNAAGDADTAIHHVNDPVQADDPPGTMGSTEIRLIELSLVSIQPITVVCDGMPTLWDVHAEPSPTTPAPAGTMTATKTHANGGFFDSVLPVQPQLTFTRRGAGGDCDGDGDVDIDDYPGFASCLNGPGSPTGVGCDCNADFDADNDVDLEDYSAFMLAFGGALGGGSDTVVLDTGTSGMPPLNFTATGVPFVHELDPGSDVATAEGARFIPGVRETVPGSIASQQPEPVTEQELLARHTICVPRKKRCIYKVTCKKGDCPDCPFNIGDMCYGAVCENEDACTTGFTSTCGAASGEECCVEFLRVDCRVPDADMMACPDPEPCTCCTLDLGIDSDNDGFTFIDVADDDPIEENAPGKFICVNDDDDNTNGVADVSDPGATMNEDDLVPIILSTDCDTNGRKWRLTFPNKVKIWVYENRSNGSFTPVVSGALRDFPMLPSFYVEGVTPSAASGDVEIELAILSADGTCVIKTDKVKATVVAARFIGQVGANANRQIPVNESLTVSNFVTTDTLPQNSAFGAANNDPENFRLEVEDATVAGGQVMVQLEVIRGGAAQITTNYTLNKKMGNVFRGEYLRLVSDAVDDAASGAGAMMDPGNQSILVQIGDTVRLTYPAAGRPRCVRELDVCRPAAENNNGANQRLHDVRTINFAFRGFVGSLPQEPFNDGDADGVRDAGEAFQNIAGAGSTVNHDANMSAGQMANYVTAIMNGFNARLAQSCVVGASATNFAVAVPGGVNLLNGIDTFNVATNPAGPLDLSAELRALLAGAGVRSGVNTDGNAMNDVIDVLFVYNLRSGTAANFVAGAAALVDALGPHVASAVGTFHGTVLYGSEQFGAFVSHYTLGHESSHIVLNQFDTAANMPTAAQRPGAAGQRDMLFPELMGNPGANTVANGGKRQSYQITGHAGQTQTYRGNSTFVR